MSIRYIIFCAAPKLYFPFGINTIFSRKGHRPKRKGRFTTILIDEDLFSASDYRMCDNEAANHEEQLITSLIKTSDYSVLEKWGGGLYAKSHLGREILWQAKRVFQSFRFAEKVYKKNNLQGTVYIWPEIFSWSIYKMIRDKKLLPDYLQLSLYAVLYLRVLALGKWCYFAGKFIFYPEYLLLKMRGKSNSIKKTFAICVYMDDGLMGFQLKPTDLIVDNKSIQNDDVLFVHEESSTQSWEKKLTKSGYNVLNMNDIAAVSQRSAYLKSQYRVLSKFRWRLFILSLKAPWAISAIYKALRLRVLWELFYKKYTVATSVRMMVAGDLTSSIVQKKHNTITQFVYFSTTEDIVDKRICDDKSACLDYTYMIFDQCVSSKLSNKWLSGNQNYIDKYIPIGPMFSDLICNANLDGNNELRNRLNISKDVLIVSFFDHTVGYSGVLNFDAYRTFLTTILELAEQYKDLYFALKSKKSLITLAKLCNGEFSTIVEKIRSHPRCIYINDYNLSSFELVGISSLVVSAPLSSVNFESLCGSTKTISYDAVNQYGDYDILSNKLPNFSAHSYSELQDLISYWMYECDDACFESFKLKYVNSELDYFCDGTAIERYRKLLCDNVQNILLFDYLE